MKAGEPSDPFLIEGFDRVAILLANDGSEPVTFTVEQQALPGWFPAMRETVPPGASKWTEWPENGMERSWARVVVDKDCAKATAFFSERDEDGRRPFTHEAAFPGLASADSAAYSAGLLHVGGKDEPVLHVAAATVSDGQVAEEGRYEMGADLKLRRVDDPAAHASLKQRAAIPEGALQADAASLIYLDEKGRRFRLPRGYAARQPELVPMRVCREVCTERDLFHAGGTFYELPAENAGGFAKIRPITTHRLRITDYCSWRGLLVLTGLAPGDPESPRVIVSDDKKARVWLGAVDELWQLGRPTGFGGPWKETPAKAGEPSDAYLANGFDRKSLALTHDAAGTVSITLQADFTGDGTWREYRKFSVPAGEVVAYEFPEAFAAYWLRFVADRDCRATANLSYR